MVPIVVFIGICADIYLNAPMPSVARNIWLASCIIALLGDEAVYYYLSECLLLAILAKEYYDEQKAKAAAPAVEVKAAPSKEELGIGKSGLPLVPATVKEILVKSMADFEKNVKSDSHTCDGKPWNLEIENSSVKIFSAEYPGLPIKRWKVVSEVVGPMESIIDELFDFEKRLHWDTAIAKGERKMVYDADGAGDKAYISVFQTAPAGGGAVSSREMADAILVKYTDDGGIMTSSVSLGPEFKSVVPCLPEKRKDPIRAFTRPGGGCALIPVGKGEDGKANKFKYILISNVELNGWLLTSVVNSATASTLKESTEVMRKHLEKKFA